MEDRQSLFDRRPRQTRQNQVSHGGEPGHAAQDRAAQARASTLDSDNRRKLFHEEILPAQERLFATQRERKTPRSSIQRDRHRRLQRQMFPFLSVSKKCNPDKVISALANRVYLAGSTWLAHMAPNSGMTVNTN